MKKKNQNSKFKDQLKDINIDALLVNQRIGGPGCACCKDRFKVNLSKRLFRKEAGYVSR